MKPFTSHFRPLLRTPILVLATALALGACSSNDDDSGSMNGNENSSNTTDPSTTDNTSTTNNPPITGNPTGNDVQLAFVATRTSKFDGGRIDRISLTDGSTVTGSYPDTASDIRVATDGENVYQVGRFKLDSITRFDATDTSAVDFQFSVNDADPNADPANPYDIVFIDGTKAYVPRYGSDKLWIVNPSVAATDEASFKIGELDLGAYDEDVPNMNGAIIVDDKLFVLMERLTGSNPDTKGYVAVFDTRTDTEIDTNQSQNDLNGIPLDTVNPASLHYNDKTGDIYVVSRGNSFLSENVPGDPYTGGLEVIDPTTYQHQLLIDDGTGQDNRGFFGDALVVSANRGYLVTNQGFTNSTLRAFNPVTGAIDTEVVAGLANVDITTLAQGPNGRLWVGINDATPGFSLIDPSNNSIVGERVTTELVPINVTFLTQSATP